jgi:hypothetical protein
MARKNKLVFSHGKILSFVLNFNAMERFSEIKDKISYIVFPHFQWGKNNLTNICIFCTDICFSPHGTTLTDLLQMSVYGCSQMLDGLFSSHPNIFGIIV